jgi:hypothetical protein
MKTLIETDQEALSTKVVDLLSYLHSVRGTVAMSTE